MSRGPRSRPAHLVVGAGAKGLMLALALARRGERVLVAEGADAPGGLARSFRYGGFTFDLGLHAFVSSRPALRALARELLGPDHRSFTASAASLLPDGSLLSDSSRWCASGLARTFHDLMGAGEEDGWNCMRVSRPPRVVSLARRLRPPAQPWREIEALGGRVLLNTRVETTDLAIEDGRVVRARLRGRWTPVRACHWAAGTDALLGRRAPAPDLLVMTHFMVRGAAPVPHHWVRLFGVTDPFAPRLAYFPAAFAPANAPAGHHGVGAVIPLRLAPRATPEARPRTPAGRRGHRAVDMPPAALERAACRRRCRAPA